MTERYELTAAIRALDDIRHAAETDPQHDLLDGLTGWLEFVQEVADRVDAGETLPPEFWSEFAEIHERWETLIARFRGTEHAPIEGQKP